MEVLADLSVFAAASACCLFALTVVLHDRPRLLAIAAVLLGGPFWFYLLSPSAQPVTMTQIAQNIGISVLLYWFVLFHPKIGFVHELASDPWVSRAKDWWWR